MVQRFATEPGGIERQAEAVIAFAGYLEALRVALVDGRSFTTADHRQPVVIVDERLSENYAYMPLIRVTVATRLMATM